MYASFNTIDGKITKVSNSFESVYDIEKKAILGKTINYLIPKGLYGAHDDLMKNFRNKGTMNVIMKGNYPFVFFFLILLIKEQEWFLD